MKTVNAFASVTVAWISECCGKGTSAQKKSSAASPIWLASSPSQPLPYPKTFCPFSPGRKSHNRISLLLQTEFAPYRELEDTVPGIDAVIVKHPCHTDVEAGIEDVILALVRQAHGN